MRRAQDQFEGDTVAAFGLPDDLCGDDAGIAQIALQQFLSFLRQSEIVVGTVAGGGENPGIPDALGIGAKQGREGVESFSAAGQGENRSRRKEAFLRVGNGESPRRNRDARDRQYRGLLEQFFAPARFRCHPRCRHWWWRGRDLAADTKEEEKEGDE